MEDPNGIPHTRQKRCMRIRRRQHRQTSSHRQQQRCCKSLGTSKQESKIRHHLINKIVRDKAGQGLHYFAGYMDQTRRYISVKRLRKKSNITQLMLQRMREGDDIQEHTRQFFDAVDKLGEMEVILDLLSIMLLYSLLTSFDNFRIAVEARDALPTLEALRIKVVEEGDTRKNETTQNAMTAAKDPNKKKPWKKKKNFNNGLGKGSVKCDTLSLFAAIENGDCLAYKTECKIEDTWCIDSGCTSHLCNSTAGFTKIGAQEPGKLNLASNAHTEIQARGTATFLVKTNEQEKKVTLNDALYMPDLQTNLISVGKMIDRGFSVVFTKHSAEIIDKKGNVQMKADRANGLYYIQTKAYDECHNATDYTPTKKMSDSKSLKEWHEKLGHLNIQYIRDAAKREILQGLNIADTDKNFQCEKSFRETELGAIIHSDVYGPMRTQSNDGARYFVTFTDDHSRYTEVRFIRNKSDVFKEFVNFRSLFETQHGIRPKCLQSDNGLEFLSNEFDNYLKQHGMTRQLTTPHNPQ